MKYELFIALRYLRAKHKQAFTSVITVISIIGIAIGVAALVVSLSLMTGMHDELRTKILGSRAHITVYGGSSPEALAGFTAMAGEIENIEGVTSAAPMIREKGLIRTSVGNEGVFVHGVEPEKSDEVLDIFRHVEFGSWENMKEEQGEYSRKGILIGKELALNLYPPPDREELIDDHLRRIVGSRVQLFTLSSSTLSPAGLTPRRLSYRVAGIFDSGDWQADAYYCFVPMEDLARFLKLGDAQVIIQVKTDDIFKAGEMKERISEEGIDAVFIRTWIEENTDFFNALQLEKMALFVAITLIVAVAALNIISTLIMLVMEKNRDIGILMSMGATSRGVMTAFLLQGLVIGIVGAVMGAILGIGVSHLLDYINFPQLPGNVYAITRIHYKVVPLDIVVVCVLALLISLLATIYPAWKASRLRPVEALRYE